MARSYVGDGKEVFRAVITTTVTEDGKEPRVFVRTYGPYNTAAPAKAMVSRETRYSLPLEESKRRYPLRQTHTGREITGRVEKASAITWTDIADPDPVEIVTIPASEYAALKEADSELEALHEWGVDNWEGYGDALSGRSVDE